MLVKLIARGRTFESAVNRARRALAEFRIRGVSTNIPFLQAVLEDEDFMAGDVSTSFIDERPELLTTHAPADRGTKLLRWLAEVTVNQPHGPAPTQLDPGEKRPGGIDINIPSPKGSAFSILVRKPLPPTCGSVSRSRSPIPLSGTPTNRCWRPGCVPRISSASHRMSGG
jgi:pyruvate carboxylase